MLADKYRPWRFEHVRGQEDAVDQLRSLARLRQGAHLLLAGAYGAGKTTLVRIFARSLNCEDLAENGSPCGRCRSCGAPERDYLVEYDVPGRGGDREGVLAWVEAHNRESANCKWRVLFLDEAHALQPAAMDALLKVVEQPQPRVVFAFATTEPCSLKAALKSRTLPLEVRPLSVPDAVALMETVAKKEKFAYDRDALVLLAWVKQGHPRDLLNGLGQVAALGSGVTTEAVKRLFAVHDAEALVEYFLALGAGDAGRAIAALQGWHEPLSSKLKAVQALLTSIFYNEIQGRKIIIDAFLDTLTSERRKIVSAFCSRLEIDKPVGLEPYWRRMLEFWLAWIVTDEEGLQLQLCLFEDLVTNRLQETILQAGGTVSVSGSLLRQSAAGAQGSPDRGRPGDMAPDRFGGRYLTPRHISEIINRSSFFMQQHGRMLNVVFSVYPSYQARLTEATAVATVRRVFAELGQLCRARTSFASVMVIERDENGVLARIAAHIPQLAEIPSFEAELLRWCEGFAAEDDILVESKVGVGLPRRTALKFHWDSVFELCAPVQDPDNEPGSARQLLDKLQIKRSLRRTPGPVEHPVLEFAGCLTNSANEAACENHMGFLSAFDAQAWSWIRKGWELEECIDRQQEARQRAEGLLEAELLWGSDEDRKRVEIEALGARWAGRPESRIRQWRGWWQA
ncbi:MAG: AAA family ATPase [Bradyrhizobium sp.]|nr:AAA family ATPase [Bradyrhizobium sp.]